MGYHFLLQGVYLLDTGIEPASLALAGGFFTIGTTWEPCNIFRYQEKLDKQIPGGSDGKESLSKAGDLGSIPGLERSPGEGNGYPLQYSGLENPRDRETWWATVHRVAKSWT